MPSQVLRHRSLRRMLGMTCVLLTGLWLFHGRRTQAQTSYAEEYARAATRGTTYYAMERVTTRVTTTFSDGIRVVSTRQVDGSLIAQLIDATGNLVSPPYSTATAPTAANRTADAANRLVYATNSGGGAVTSITSEWPNEIVTQAATTDGIGSFEVIYIQADHALGKITYDASSQMLSLQLPGVTPFGQVGLIGPAELDHFGGWPFTPDLAWGGVQAYALPALQQAMLPPVARWFDRLLNAGVPTLAANQPGCDWPFHWLDGTLLRLCCDSHDRCYYANGCSAWSWIWWGPGNWACEECNAAVVYCFEVTIDYCALNPRICETDPRI